MRTAASRGPGQGRITGMRCAAWVSARGPICRVGQVIAARGSRRDPRLHRRRTRADQMTSAPAPQRTVEHPRSHVREGSTVRREDLGFLRELAARRVHQGISSRLHPSLPRRAARLLGTAYAEEARGLRSPELPALRSQAQQSTRSTRSTSQAPRPTCAKRTRLRTQSGRVARDLVERLIHGQPIDPGRRHPAAPGPGPGRPAPHHRRQGQQTTLAVATRSNSARDTAFEQECPRDRPGRSRRSATESFLITAGNLGPRTKKSPAFAAARQRTIEKTHPTSATASAVPSQGFASVQGISRSCTLAAYTSPSRPDRLARRPFSSLDAHWSERPQHLKRSSPPRATTNGRSHGKILSGCG